MPRFAANLTLLFNEVDFLDRFEQAANAGFTGVEMLFPYAWPKEAIAQRLKAHGLTQVLFNLPAGDWDVGERGIAGLPGREAEFQAGVARAIDYAKTLGCHQMNCLAGLRPEGVSDEVIWAQLVSNVRYAAQALATERMTLTVEAINTRVDMPGFLLDTSTKVMRLIDDVGEPNVRLQYDIYHMQIMEGDLLRTITRLLPSIGHIQIADNPGRHEPGTGEINYRHIFDCLDALGYDGWVSAEYRPSTTTVASLGWLSGQPCVVR